MDYELEIENLKVELKELTDHIRSLMVMILDSNNLDDLKHDLYNYYSKEPKL